MALYSDNMGGKQVLVVPPEDPVALARLRAASLADADVYTLEKRVTQFADGIARCLGR